MKYLVLVFLAFAVNAAAQTISMFPYPNAHTTIEARYLHILPNKGTTAYLDGTYDIGVNFPATNRINLVGSIPFMHDAALANSWAIGNMFAGIQIATDSTHQTIATLGMFLPTAATTTSPIPLFLDRYELQRFAADYVVTFLNVAGRIARSKDLTLRGEIGTNYFASTKRGDTSTILVHYGLAAEIGNEDYTFTFEYTALVNFATSFQGVSDRYLHFIGLGATMMGKHVQPAVMIQLPINQSLLSVVDGAIGIKCGFVL